MKYKFFCLFQSFSHYNIYNNNAFFLKKNIKKFFIVKKNSNIIIA